MNDSRTPLPERIGPYRILDVLGEGGMGIVYEADETGPVRRRVAIKVIRAGLDSREAQARFEAERQALAMMDHAGIAKVLHAGQTDEGQPYVVMELVRGQPLTAYCDAHRLTVAERIALFINVCHAVQHAHQKGVIHRDLKPANVLVVEEDTAPRPKIIDFGVAKALGRPLTERTLVTHVGTAVGTAAYMSPEQADGSGFDVDTRTDIYSLGVILYELLVGRLPVEPDAKGYHAFLARLASREWQAPLPSDRLATLGGERSAIAHVRRTDPDRLRRYLRGDLDWIVLKALEPERGRRYPTVNALALDLQRALQHEPVSARPPSTAYRVGKFVRRHRVGVAVGVVAGVALTASAAGAALGFVRATRAEQRAEAEATAAREVTDFVVGLFGVFDPDEPRGNLPVRNVSARELLDRGAERAARELEGQPAQQARILRTMGTAYMQLGLYGEATRQLTAAAAAQERVLGADAPELAQTLIALGQSTRSEGKYEDAERHFQRALAINERAHGPSSPAAAKALAALAILRWRQSRLAEAESLYLRVLQIDEAALDPFDPLIARDLMGLGIVYWQQGRFDEAEPLMRRSLEIRERIHGAEHPTLANVLNNLGAIYYERERFDVALRYYDRARGIYESTLDPTHPNIASVLNNVGEAQWKLGRAELAEPLLRRALAIKEVRLAPGDPSVANTLQALGGVLRDRRAFREAETVFRRALDIRVRHFPAGNRAIQESARDLAALLRSVGRAAEADVLVARYLSE